ncbi:MAG: hypothetical protein GAK45_00776 [Pseudomonas citronellolis]|nr:MAG: hypothetical protein GAK45_00776 [Pseudomonas citronellolis]
MSPAPETPDAYAAALRHVLLGQLTGSAAQALLPIDPERLTDAQIVSLLPLIWRLNRLTISSEIREVAAAIRLLDAQRRPALHEGALLALLGLLVEGVEEAHEVWPCVVALLGRAAQLPLSADGGLCVRTLLSIHAPGSNKQNEHLARLLAAQCVDVQCEEQEWRVVQGDSRIRPLQLEELSASRDWPLDIRLALTRLAECYPQEACIDPAPSLVRQLASHLPCLEYAQCVLLQAQARGRAVQEGAVAYAADKAFSVEEAAVLWRATRLALECDAPWLGALLQDLLPDVSVAPTAAKSMPSQSVSIALAKAVNAMPTPETLAALAEANRVVRHAGVARKLTRHLRSAERRLGERPLVALRMAGDGKAWQKQLGKALEHSYLLDTQYTADTWLQHLGSSAAAQDIVAALVWEFCEDAGQWFSARPIFAEHGLLLEAASGERHAAPGPSAQVRLWHPARASSDARAAWRELALRTRWVQPFRQIFREHYSISEQGNRCAMFAGHVLSLRPLLGLARSQGWTAQRFEGLHREFGPWRVALELDAEHLYPGATGWTAVDELRLSSTKGDSWGHFGQLSPVLASEMLRAVDLLISVSNFAEPPAADANVMEENWRLSGLLLDLPLGTMARLRRWTLMQMFRGVQTALPIEFGEREAQIGACSVHLATGHVRRNGQWLALKLPPRLPAKAQPWLPYDDALLKRIAHTLAYLAQGDID